MLRLGCPPEPCPVAKSAPLVSRSSPAPPASPSSLSPHYLYLAGVCPLSGWFTHIHSHTHKSQEQTVPESSSTPALGLCRSLPHAFPSLTTPPAASSKLGALALGLSCALSLSVFFLFFLFLFFSFLRKQPQKKDNEKKNGKRHVSEEMSLSVVFGELVS